jgi:methyltransferase-like protein/SAM-dependent methyltransferase
MAKAENQSSLIEKRTPSTSTYDAVPYDSHPFPQTHPLLLQGIGRIFGLSAPAPDTARILEIGCAAGANILAIASCYPQSKCVGIDYSLKQIDAGQKEVKSLGLANLELKHMSVTEVTKSFGTFDYILCHGVLSWVPADVQDKIFEVCNSNLAPDGIAYISYNTLPGWNSVRSVRDMMLYHTARFDDPATKVQQARSLLQFMNDSTKDSKSTMAKAIEREIQILVRQPDNYLLHEHLEEHNTAFYFYEFMAKAHASGLQYLGDTSIESMYSGNLPKDTVKVLATSDDLVRTEQYMDFINDRRFRQTLLCHSDRILNRNVSPDILCEGWVVSRFGYPEGFAQHDLRGGQHLDFQAAGNIKFTSNDPLTLALLQVLLEHQRDPVRVGQLAGPVRDKLKKSNLDVKEEGGNTLERRICFLLMRQLFTGGISFYLDKMPYATTVLKKPVASKLARHQAKHQEWVSSQCQVSIHLTAFDRVLIGYLDGTRDAAALVECMLPHFASKALVMNQNNVPIEDMSVVQSILPSTIAERLVAICDRALLVK